MQCNIEELLPELGRLPDESSRKGYLGRFGELVDRSTVVQLADAVRRQVRIDVPEALRLADMAVLIADQLGDDESLALARRAKANALWFMGECREAVDLFHQAAELFEKSGNMSEVGRTLSGSIQSHILLGEYACALSAADRARSIFSSLGDPVRLARLELNAGNIYHRQNHFADALNVYERAFQQLLPLRDMEAIGVALHNMAVCYIALDDFHGALETYQRMRALCREQPMPLLMAQADYNISYLYYLRGDYTQALDLLRLTRETCVKNNDKYHLALCDMDQSEIYLELRLVDEAADMAERGFVQFRELGMSFEAAKSLANLAWAAALEKNSKRALQLFAEAKEMMIREKNRAWPSLLDLYQALVLFSEEDFVEARRLCVEALKFFGSTTMPSKHLVAILLLAKICLRTGDLDNALSQIRGALELVSQLESPILRYQTHFLAGEIWEALQQPDLAYDSYREARYALEALRSSIEAEELKISFMRDKSDVYARLVQICFDRAPAQSFMEEAFSYVEEAKSRSLRDLIAGRLPQPPCKEQETETARRIHELRRELNWFYKRIEREQLSQDGISPEVLESLQVRASQHERELLRLSRELPAEASPRALSNSRTAALSEIRSALEIDTALVEYFAIGEQLFAAVITKSQLEFRPLVQMSGLSEALRMLQFQMSKFRLGRDYIARFREPLLSAAKAHLETLYKQVFSPLEDLLTDVRRLVIVPFGGLHSLPFHALFDGNRFLVDKFTVLYTPSASIYALSDGHGEARSGPSLVVGVEDAKTPFIRQEIQTVAAKVPNPKILWGSGASEQALRTSGASSQLIHIASHGYFREDSPMFSAIRLADSYLSLYDLYHMDLPAELLTLSGCVTGLNVITEGEEMLGLARGLLFAGAHSLLLSLWDVDDQSTAHFMGLFYSHLQQTQDKAQAIRSAMLELRTEYPHPYYWAPFRLIGKAAS